MHSASKFTLKMVSVYLITQLKSPLTPALAGRLAGWQAGTTVYGVYGLFITHHYERHTLGLVVILGAWLLSRMGFTQTLFQIQPTLHRNEIRMFSFQP